MAADLPGKSIFLGSVSIDLFANTIAQAQNVEQGALWDRYGSNLHLAPYSKLYVHAPVFAKRSRLRMP